MGYRARMEEWTMQVWRKETKRRSSGHSPSPLTSLSQQDVKIQKVHPLEFHRNGLPIMAYCPTGDEFLQTNMLLLNDLSCELGCLGARNCKNVCVLSNLTD